MYVNECCVLQILVIDDAVVKIPITELECACIIDQYYYCQYELALFRPVGEKFLIVLIRNTVTWSGTCIALSHVSYNMYSFMQGGATVLKADYFYNMLDHLLDVCMQLWCYLTWI